ncbi:hypothetical protein FIE12Z_7270 [Fusarium flagelliforme]|uniref:Uncharacterized protein n=1 Tax=Fusarium flagelliforme TaxID=2675880 RepID=A0A395MKQ0_9HYPO|nr:hypothetical protein FIE12Z_7270 [Fusarium flagelliforme]
MAFTPKLPTIVEEDEEASTQPVHCIYCCTICKRARTCEAVLREQAKARLKAKAKAKARAGARAKAKAKPKIKVTVNTSTITIPKASKLGEICGQIWPDGNGHFTMKLWDGILRPNVSSNVWYFKSLSPYEITLFEIIYPNGLPDFTDEDRKKLNADAMGWFNDILDSVLLREDMEFFEDEVARLSLIEID